jgi:hypothetical protein
VALRVAFDLDGVLADMDRALNGHAEQLFGVRRPADVTALAAQDHHDDSRARESGLTSRQTARLWRHIADIENYWESLEETEPGAVARLDRLAAHHSWEVIFLTRRPSTRGITTQAQSQRWLESKGFERPSVYVVQRSRGKVADALDVDAVVDDDTDNCLDVSRYSTARPILICRNGAKVQIESLRRLGICCVPSVGAALDALVAMDRPRRVS